MEGATGREREREWNRKRNEERSRERENIPDNGKTENDSRGGSEINLSFKVS